MTERSWPWPGVTVGDAGPYSADEWDDMFERRFGSGVAPYNDRGVIRNWANELAGSDGGANQFDVDTGAALVHGKHYDNDAVVNVAVPNSVGAWREDLICLQSVTAAQTIRIARHANPADGVVYPAPTQTAATWEIPLWAVRINAAGAITLITDLRDFVSTLMQPKVLQVRPNPYSGSDWGFVGAHGLVVMNAINEDGYFEFLVPSDFLSIITATLYYIPTGTGTWDWTTFMDAGACDELHNAHSDTCTADGEAVTTLEVECLDVSACFDGILPYDLVGFRVRVDAFGGSTTEIRLALLVIEYR